MTSLFNSQSVTAHVVKSYALSSLLIVGLSSSHLCQADTFLGIYAGAGQWFNDYSGSFASEGPSIDVKSDLAFEQENQTFLYAALEHPIPLLPNIKVARTQLQAENALALNSRVVFRGETFNINTNVNSDIDLSHLDATLYYEVLDNWVSLDLGLTARRFTGEASITGAGQRAATDIKETIPMAYGMAKFEFPLTGFYARGELNFTQHKDDSIIDYTLAVGVESALRFGGELGYRYMNFELKDMDDFSGDVTTDGFFLALTLHI